MIKLYQGLLMRASNL